MASSLGSLDNLLALPIHSGCGLLVEGEEVSEWRAIDSAPESGDVDLFGYINYDLIEMRLTDCEKIDGQWHYFCCGEMVSIDTIGFNPTHWMPLPENP